MEEYGPADIDNDVHKKNNISHTLQNYLVRVFYSYIRLARSLCLLTPLRKSFLQHRFHIGVLFKVCKFHTQIRYCAFDCDDCSCLQQ